MTRIFEGRFVIVDLFQDIKRSRASEVVRTKNGRYSVGFLIYHRGQDSIILVEQNRPAMICETCPEGLIEEVPAGRCDRPESPREVIAREASEEVGAEIYPDQIVLLNGGEPLAMSPGILEEMMYLGYVKIEPEQLAEDRLFGLPEEGEFITRKLIPVSVLYELQFQDMKTFALVQWFLREIKHHQEAK